jgi:hypothetical protein
MFPIYSNMPRIGLCAFLACALGFGLFGWLGAASGVLSVLAFFVWMDFRRARKLEREKAQGLSTQSAGS